MSCNELFSSFFSECFKFKYKKSDSKPKKLKTRASFLLNLLVVFFSNQPAPKKVLLFDDQIRTILANFLQTLPKSIGYQMYLAVINIKETFPTCQFTFFHCQSVRKVFFMFRPSKINASSLEIDKLLSMIVLVISDFS